MDWWLSRAWETEGPAAVIAWVAWVIVSITLHELGHGFAAIRCGDDVPMRTGHMTLNPFVHIPFPSAWITFALFGFTWGQMPVQPMNFRGRYDDAKVAFAGPLVNLLLGVGCLIFLLAWLYYAPPVHTQTWRVVAIAASIGLRINVMGFIFNLLPLPPLDGSRILADFYPKYAELWRGRQGGSVIVVLGVILFLFGGRAMWAVTDVVCVAALNLGQRFLGMSP